MKIERTTVSLSGDLMEAAQRHCDEMSVKFSNYVEKLVRADLQAEGKLGDVSQQRARLVATAEDPRVGGLDNAITILEREARKRRKAA